jgi:uncharacterized protein (DUF1778 family)
MAASAHNVPLPERRIERIGFRTTENESTLIRQAADLRGCSITQYVLCAVLDRAERDLYEHAAHAQHDPSMPASAAEPLHALASLFSA